eukprot:PhM_4_TR10828/c0_g1_i1/m.63931/K02727/PSMA3; 20S proteasome subunit alpha 7
MSGIGTGYDLGVDTYSPEGRIFQVEYASKAVDNSGTAIGICCKDGVVVGVEKLLPSKMVESSTMRRIYALDKQCGVCVAGLQPDGRQIVERGRDECSNYRDTNSVPITCSTLVDRLGYFMQLHTLYWSYRPFGCAVLVASYADDGPQLHLIDPSGTAYGYRASAVGKAKTLAKAELEKVKFEEITCREGVKEVARILTLVHDDAKDKLYEYELGWVCDESQQTFTLVPEAVKKEAVKYADEATRADKERTKDSN